MVYLPEPRLLGAEPARKVGDIIARPLRLYGIAPGRQVTRRVAELLELVQLSPEYGDRQPSELSGGETQRVGVAKTFADEPDLIVADEPLSALGVSMQTSILNLLIDLQGQFRTSYPLISHDLNTVRWLCDQVVMYLGNICEADSGDDSQGVAHSLTSACLFEARRLTSATVSQLFRSTAVLYEQSHIALRSRLV
jgi:peptide/nickel transport system ATP-binding protein